MYQKINKLEDKINMKMNQQGGQLMEDVKTIMKDRNTQGLKKKMNWKKEIASFGLKKIKPQMKRKNKKSVRSGVGSLAYCKYELGDHMIASTADFSSLAKPL